MNILVCVKQVPDTTEIKIDPVTKTLIRAGVPSILNPFDSYALEMALRIKDVSKGRVVVLSMGPTQARNVLKECLSVGADAAYLVSDRAFGGSDTLATSYILSCAIDAVEEREGKFDVILCGKQAIDGDTAQVGPEIAEQKNLPQVTCAIEISAESQQSLLVKKENETGYQEIRIHTPCVITATKPNFELRWPTLRSKIDAISAEIPVITAADIAIDLTRAGLKGSPTKVSRSFTPDMAKNSVQVEGNTASDIAQKLVRLMAEII
ncbi:MAG: electron transfer flavoprotein subunit beta/FixA family protein [Ruminococcaceae bacterium]|nr:electron transfer flavoprotein subunit beta/FixA family protein [Oscillospiraceae bacterium]